MDIVTVYCEVETEFICLCSKSLTQIIKNFTWKRCIIVHQIIYQNFILLTYSTTYAAVALTTHPQSRVEVKESVELYLYSSSGASCPVLG